MIPDFRDESCTYLMLRLKVALKKEKGAFSFLGTSTQVKTVEGAFPKSGYAVDVTSQDEKDTYLITLTPSTQK
ncbi:MAG TPA: hypothetical protein O0X44_02960 [Methanocorpusculum sp.]|nr:hypothetical protein [Methanocorpusculum sp.]HJK00516.1 hypothetical protein [Methanocorpusculum sp.]HJK06375.1 hypothetical protein [Methanocorpusculum sp.]HJK15216.1 hypothetical protein [Methanocorpusculum sp.]HJK16512.1 hypothetical protein [Methanocorpusculum sp.]